MGAPVSKFGQEINEEKPSEGSLPSTPILTPKSPKTRLNDLDPRSPSDNVVRTPIEVLLGKDKKRISVDSNDSLNLENDCDTFNIYSPGVILKSIDPRSPTTDFERTPILVPENKSNLPTKLHNKNFDNVRKALIHFPQTNPVTKTPEKIIPPILLESKTISPKASVNKRRSYAGLLETNLDYVETDLDNVKRNIEGDGSPENKMLNTSRESCSNSLKDDSSCEPILQMEVPEEYSTPMSDRKISISKEPARDIYLNESIDPRSPTNDFIRTPIHILKKLESLEINDSVNKVPHVTQIFTDCDDDGLRTTISHKYFDEPENESTLKSKEYVESQLEQETIKDFDKKLSNLIYEDQDKSESIIRNRKITENGSRTPLGTRNSNTNPKKRIPQLKVHDKPQKNAREFSRIPVFQNKKIKGRFMQQCENTPPKNMDDGSKLRKQQWDPDNTLII